MTYELYLITNLINGKKYVGQTNSNSGYLNRFKQHVAESFGGYIKHTSALHKAIKKYGPENFSVKRLMHSIPEGLIDYYETLWIDKLKTHIRFNNGYNMTDGGQGVHGYKHTEQTLKQISESSKAYWDNLRNNYPEKYAYLCTLRSENLKGKPKSIIARKNSSIAAKKRFENEPGTFTGKKHTAEAKQKVAEANGSPVVMIDMKTDEILMRFISAMEATRYLIDNKLTSNIYANARILLICNGGGKSAYGFKWKYADEV